MARSRARCVEVSIREAWRGDLAISSVARTVRRPGLHEDATRAPLLQFPPPLFSSVPVLARWIRLFQLDGPPVHDPEFVHDIGKFRDAELVRLAWDQILKRPVSILHGERAARTDAT